MPWARPGGPRPTFFGRGGGAIVRLTTTAPIRTVSAQEAPVAYHIGPGDNSFGPEFDIRSFDGKLWWPLFDGAEHLSVKNYIASATNSNGHFLSMMNLSPASVASKRLNITELLQSDLSINRVTRSSLDERWLSAEHVAARTLFCDNVVYLEGGQPAYFGISCGMDSDLALSLEIGSLDVFARWLPDPRTNRRHDAACRSLVFRIEDMESEAEELEKEGFRLDFNARAAVCMEVEAGPHPSDVCVDALVRRALKTIDTETALKLHKAMNGKTLATTSGIINRSVCQEALNTMVSMYPPEDIRIKFGFELEWVKMALERLEARTLAAVDWDAIGNMRD
jgi:hypothetical protein